VRVMVSVGTHEQPFQRLLDAVADVLAVRPGDEWIVQFGVGRWSVQQDGVRSADYLDAVAMQEALRWADVLVSQASPGNVFGALAASTWPLVLGRSHAAGEHVDDHQIRFARALDGLGRATDLVRPERLDEALTAHARLPVDDREARIARAVAAARANERTFRREVWDALGVTA
jgi:UDP-N-acetylglucosamine transferase subunit ALG13